MREVKATSLREIEELVLSMSGDRRACFRGQSHAAWDLVPSAYRSLIPFVGNPDFDQNWPNQLERDTYREFEIQARRSFDQPFDFLERLSIAQHHGIPTRLLDWTSKLDIAAYFSVCEEDQEDCAIWYLKLEDLPFPGRLGRQLPDGGFPLAKINEYGLNKVPSFAQPLSENIPASGKSNSAAASGSPDDTFIVWKPPYSHPRLERQKCLLSWYHSFEECDPVWNYSAHIKEIEARSGKELLCKIVIPSEHRPQFRKEILRKLNEYDLFPDLDGLGKSLARQHHVSMANGLFIK